MKASIGKRRNIMKPKAFNSLDFTSVADSVGSCSAITDSLKWSNLWLHQYKACLWTGVIRWMNDIYENMKKYEQISLSVTD